jgi:hypothetical protein
MISPEETQVADTKRYKRNVDEMTLAKYFTIKTINKNVLSNQDVFYTFIRLTQFTWSLLSEQSRRYLMLL